MTSPIATTSLQLNSSSIHAQHFNILNHTQVVQTSTRSSRRDPIEILQENVAFGALHDSAERFDPPKCHPQTRTAILDRIDTWARDVSDSAKPILWLTGPAGAGKSAIAQTLVERWNERDIIAIAFFFWRTSSERNQKTRLIPTLAFQLLEHFPSTRNSVEISIDSGGFFKRNLAFQLENLIVQPLLSVHGPGSTPLVIVIDGLDECCCDLPKAQGFKGQSHESQQREILEAVASACRKAPSLRFMIVSRPERQIRESFREGILKECSTSLSLNNVENADTDVRLFLDCKLEEIRQHHCIEPPWPTTEQISKLVERSSGQFIYSSIAVKHISRARSNPVESLKVVLELQPQSMEKPFAELDALYTLVLKSVTAESIPVVLDVLGTIGFGTDYVYSVFKGWTGMTSPLLFEHFFLLPEGGVYSHLTDLHSILDIPSDPSNSIEFAHATLYEYLQDQSRSGDFFISKESVRCRCILFALRHIEKCMEYKNLDMYHPVFLDKLCDVWLPDCLPSKDIKTAAWSILESDIGPYPSKSRSYKHKALEIGIAIQSKANSFCGLIEEWNRINAIEESRTGKDEWKIHRGAVLEQVIRYLQKCNIPEIESSWWRRYLVRRHLEIAMFRSKEEANHMAPINKADIALQGLRVLFRTRSNGVN